MKKIRVEVYKASDGSCPFERWFLKLTAPIQAVIQTRIDRLEKNNFGDVKRITGARGLYEIRVHIGPGYRIYFTKVRDTIIILLNGGPKKSQSRNIAKAQEFLVDVLRRKKK